MNVIFTLIGIYFVAWLVWVMLMPKTRRGNLLVDGHSYTYVLGDNQIADVSLVHGASQYNGIAIDLPKTLPHIYLDSHHDDNISGPRFFIPPKHKVSLEGNFDKHFQLYAAEGYKQLALSVISPDVMQTLIDSAGSYDVEIKDRHLRLISQKPLFRNQKLQDDMLVSTEKVLTEIAQRLKSWSVADAAKAHETALPVEYTQTIKVGRRAVRESWFRYAYISVLLGILWTMSAFGGEEAAAKGNKDVLVYTFGSWQYFLGLLVCLALPISLLKLFSRGKESAASATRRNIATAIEIAKQTKK